MCDLLNFSVEYNKIHIKIMWWRQGGMITVEENNTHKNKSRHII